LLLRGGHLTQHKLPGELVSGKQPTAARLNSIHLDSYLKLLDILVLCLHADQTACANQKKEEAQPGHVIKLTVTVLAAVFPRAMLL
jgi:hypothetical protein